MVQACQSVSLYKYLNIKYDSLRHLGGEGARSIKDLHLHILLNNPIKNSDLQEFFSFLVTVKNKPFFVLKRKYFDFPVDYHCFGVENDHYLFFDFDSKKQKQPLLNKTLK